MNNARLWWIARGIAAVLLAVYFITVLVERMSGAGNPMAIDGDQPQAVWHYWRYHVPGALPPGHLLTDYAFVMHAPPAWWAMMASLSTFFEPLLSAKILQVVSWTALAGAIIAAVGKRTEWLVAFAAAFLCFRSPAITSIIAGGYARSFGPFLTVLFLGAFLLEKHRLCLAILVLQAALYPSVVVPSGLTYGAYCVIKGPMKERLRRCAGMFVAGLLVIGFGMFQEIAAPKWWGTVVTYAEAEKMPAWHAGGRSAVVPLPGARNEINVSIGAPFTQGGHALLPLTGFSNRNRWFLALPALLALLAVAVDRARRLWHGNLKPMPPLTRDMKLPWQFAALAMGSLAGYAVARTLAFKLYLPDRQLSHVLPYLIYAGYPVLVWCGARAVTHKRWLAVVITLLALSPIVLARGDGLMQHSSYRNLSGDKDMFSRVRQLPLTATVACDRYWCENIGVFAYHRAFVSRNLAHPFRPGFYNEMERRLVETHKALYATSWDDVIAFADREKIDYFLYDTANLNSPEKKLFRPVTEKILPLWKKGHEGGMVMTLPPEESVIFRKGHVVLVDVQKLKAAPKRVPLIGPLPEPAPAEPVQ